MNRLLHVFLFAAAYLSHQHHVSVALEVGDEVCITGYVMDHWCLEETGGKLLDNNKVITLQNPEKHSFHCLLDIGVCRDSGFQVLGEKDPANDRHSLGFRLAESDRVLEHGRATGKKGYCSTCTGTSGSNPVNGYCATVKGTISEMGSGGDSVASTPLLNNIEMVDASVGCGNLTDISSNNSCAAMSASGSNKMHSVGFGSGIIWTSSVAALLLLIGY